MKSLLIIIDGLGDDQVPALGYKTTFNYAKHENIDNIAANKEITIIRLSGRIVTPYNSEIIKDTQPKEKAQMSLIV